METDALRDVPEGWISCLVGDVTLVVGGGTPDTKDSDNFSEHCHAWITPADLSNYNSMYIGRGKRDLSETGLRTSSAKVMPVGSVLFSSRAPIGYVAIAANSLSTNQGFKSFVCTSAVVPEYLYWYLKYAKPLAEALAAGTTFQEISGSNAARIPLVLPPLIEQRRIASAIEALSARLDAARASLDRVPTILKRFRQSVLAAACSGRLTADWREQNSPSETGEELLQRILKERRERWVADGRRGKYVEPQPPDTSELPELPEGWVWANFGSVISELRNGISTRPAFQPPGIRTLRISSVRSGNVSLNDVRYFPDGENLIPIYGLRKGDLLFTRYNGSLDLLGVCGMVRETGDEPLLYPDKLMRVRVGHPLLLPEFVELFFGTIEARNRITAVAKSSAGQQGVSGEDIKSQPIAIPPIAEQEQIVEMVARLMGLLDTVVSRYDVSKSYLDTISGSILNRAFSGQLVPTEAELAREEGRSYETADELLARVRAERAIDGEAKPKKRSVKTRQATLAFE